MGRQSLTTEQPLPYTIMCANLITAQPNEGMMNREKIYFRNKPAKIGLLDVFHKTIKLTLLNYHDKLYKPIIVL
jgi:hypothetical protein